MPAPRRPLARKPLVAGIALVIGTCGGPALAQVEPGPVAHLEEVTVSARKRDESLQEVPISLQSLDTTQLSELAVTSFEDYALMLPSVSFKSFGHPGSATIFMRGVSDGGDGNASGSQPSVALYLDEQPVTAIAANLDVHIYDIARIEALAGPQGTLFGASAESGALRIITNQPTAEGFEGRVDVGLGSTTGGDESYSFEGFANIPLGEKAAIRLVGWALKDGGWIDNVAGTRTYTLEGGYGYNENNFGRTQTINNDSQIKDNFNELDKDGLRAALKVDLSEDWTATASVLYQNMESTGVWEIDPRPVADGGAGNDHSIQRFSDEKNTDEFTQFGLTVRGEVLGHSLTYAGSYLDRDVNYQTDYSKYGEDAYFVPYYACDYSATGPNLATQSRTDCTSLFEYYTAINAYKRTSHELRLQSIGEGRLQYTLGFFYQNSKHDYLQRWIQPGMSPTQEVPGYEIDNVYFRTDQQREETQQAIFGELYFNITDAVKATFGARHYDEESKVKGVVGWGPGIYCPDDPACGDTSVDQKISFTGEIYKLGLSWNVTTDHMLYATYSEGYRPGGLNRDPGLVETAGTQSWVPDELTNYEMGWKTTWLDQQLRWNGAVYLMDWDKVQYTIYDFSLSACCGNVYNLSTARVKGFETDLTWMATGGLTFSLAFAYTDAKTTADFTIPSGKLAVPKGTELPNVPKFKLNASARYEFTLGSFGAYGQLAYNHTGESWSEIRPVERHQQDAYDLLNFTAGIHREGWGVDFYVDNVTDEVADYYVKPRNYEFSIVTNRPRSFGAKLWKSF